MKKIVDETGRIIPGMLRNSNGAIIIKPDSSINNQIIQNEIISRLNKQVTSLEQKLDLILEKLNG